MEKPTRLAFSEEATFRFLRGEILIFIFITIFAFTAALVTSDASLVDLALPAAVLGFVGLGLVGVFILIARVNRIKETILIKRMFEGEIWESWQFSSPEWQVLVDNECNLINSKEDGLNPYLGAVYSSIFGLVFAFIIIAVGLFAIKEQETKIMMWIIAIIVFLLFLGAGLIQPTVAKYKEDRYRRMAMQVAEPRVWFAADGFYHETLGYASLKDLQRVTDQTQSRKRIQFALVISTDESDDLVKIPVPVPAGSEERAGELVIRYRHDRLGK